MWKEISNISHVHKYFQKIPGLLRSWRLALPKIMSVELQGKSGL
jgi:hypothetical protein